MAIPLVDNDSALEINDWQFYLICRRWLVFEKNYRIISIGLDTNNIFAHDGSLTQLDQSAGVKT